MNSIFTVETSKGSKLHYTINLGADMLDGLTESQLRAKAEQSVRIDIQGKLRSCNSEAELKAKLAKIGFPDAEVTEGIEKTVSPLTLLKRAQAEMGPEAFAQWVLENIPTQK